MKRVFRLCMLWVFCLLCIPLGQVQAFDFMADVDEVSRDPLKAYTLYIGMPWGDFLANYSNLPGWAAYGKMAKDKRFFIKNGSLNSSVGESICVERVFSNSLRGHVESGVRSYQINFATNSLEIADRIFNRISNNLEENLGRYMVAEESKAEPSDGIYCANKTKTWIVNGQFINVEIIYSLKDNCFEYDSDIILKGKYVVLIRRWESREKYFIKLSGR